jgi:hypothetical protein
LFASHPSVSFSSGFAIPWAATNFLSPIVTANSTPEGVTGHDFSAGQTPLNGSSVPRLELVAAPKRDARSALKVVSDRYQGIGGREIIVISPEVVREVHATLDCTLNGFPVFLDTGKVLVVEVLDTVCQGPDR